MEHTIRQTLLEAAEDSYRDFSAALVPGATNMLGVRLPTLRKLARQIYKETDWRAFLAQPPLYFEETMLQGMVIGLAACTYEDFCALVPPFVPQISNWSVCDSFCSSLRAAATFREPLFSFLLPYTQAQKEFEVRFGVVMLMDYFVDEPYLDRVIAALETVHQEGYYAKMAVAWALSVCFAKFPARTMDFLRTCHLDSDTYQKTLQKIVESRRVSTADKAVIRDMKKRGK